MRREQFLLLKLAEECAEVAQRASKQIQFGDTEVQVGQSLTNGERLKQELLDLNVIVGMLQDSSEIPTWSKKEYKQAMKAKKQKLQKYIDLSVKLGRLPEIKI